MVTTTIRISKQLHSRLVELAKAEHRSLNGQITQILEEAIDVFDSKAEAKESKQKKSSGS